MNSELAPCRFLFSPSLSSLANNINVKSMYRLPTSYVILMRKEPCLKAGTRLWSKLVGILRKIGGENTRGKRQGVFRSRSNIILGGAKSFGC